MKILFLTRSLEVGGAERQLAALATGLQTQGHKVTVLTFYPGGAIEADIAGTGVELVSLNKSGRWDLLRFFFRLVMAIRKARPDILHSYLATPNMLAVMLMPFYRKMKVVWGILASNMDLKNYDKLTRLTYWMEKSLSAYPHFIIVNSQAGLDVMIAHGYPENKMIAISNGINLNHFYIDSEERKVMRKEFGVGADITVVGLAGRLDPMKDHANFLKAASILVKGNQNLRFICVGSGPDKYRDEMHALADELGLSGVVIWAGERNDMRAIYNSFDIAVSSSSYGEGSPNVIGEAMACGLPCVVTDVGDTAWIVGDTGLVAPPESAEKLAEGIAEMINKIDKNRASLSTAALGRIKKEFSVPSMTNNTLEVFSKLL